MALVHQSVMSDAHAGQHTRSKLAPGSTNWIVALLLVSIASACGANWWNRAAATAQRGSGGINQGSVGMSLRTCVAMTFYRWIAEDYTVTSAGSSLPQIGTRAAKCATQSSCNRKRTVRSIGTMIDGLQPNALPISRAAPIDRDVIVAEISTQNRLDLARRERRRLHGLVRRRPSRCIHSWLCYTLVSWSRNWQMT